MSAKVTIIGSGMAGVSAALAAKSRGADVALIKGRPGATALASGAWDVGCLDGASSVRHWDRLPSPRQALQELSAQALHPYAVLHEVVDEDLATLLEGACEDLFSHMPYRPQGSLDQAMALLTPAGTIKVTAFADPAQAAGNLVELKGARLLIAGIPGVAGFAPLLIKQVMQRSFPLMERPPFVAVEEAWLEIEELPQHSLSPFALAERLAEAHTFEALSQALRYAVKQKQATHVLIPPLLGLMDSPHLIERLSDAVSAQCFEPVSTVPSVPGLRRHRALEAVLQKAGVSLINGDVTGYESAGDVVTQLIVKHGDEESIVDVEKVVLSTGRFIGNGLVHNDVMKEAIFGLPAFNGEGIVGDRFLGHLLQRDYLASHDLFRVGVRCDTSCRPVDRWGETPFKNLHAAGSLLQGYEGGGSGAGTGVAILSGWVAGREAAV